MRWISSMNSTSPGTRLDSRAARSPACWIAGPLDMRSGRSLSCATIIASVVLPSPGGPASRMWSGVRFCIAAASSSSCSCPRTFAWPTNSARMRGRSAPSKASSASRLGRRRVSASSSSTARRSRAHLPRPERGRARGAAARHGRALGVGRARPRPRRRPARRPARSSRGRRAPRRRCAAIDRCRRGACAAGDAAGAASLPASETTMSFAVFGPMPETLRNGRVVLGGDGARRSRRG